MIQRLLIYFALYESDDLKLLSNKFKIINYTILIVISSL